MIAWFAAAVAAASPWSVPEPLRETPLELPAGVSARVLCDGPVDVGPEGAAEVLGLPDGAIVPAAAERRTLEIRCDGRGWWSIEQPDGAAAWDRWQRSARAVPEMLRDAPGPGGARLAAQVRLRASAVGDPGVAWLGLVHDVSLEAPLAASLRMSSRGEAPVEPGAVAEFVVTGPGVVRISFEPEAPGPIRPLSVRVEVGGSSYDATRWSTGALPSSTTLWVPPGTHLARVTSASAEPLAIEAEGWRWDARLTEPPPPVAASGIAAAELAWLRGDRSAALDAFRALAEAPGSPGDLARARIVEGSSDPDEIAAAASAPASTRDGAEAIAAAALLRSAELPRATVASRLAESRDPDPVLVAAWLDSEPGPRPRGLALLHLAAASSPEAARAAIGHASRFTVWSPLDPSSGGLATTEWADDGPGVPRARLRAGDTGEASLPERSGRFPILRIWAPGAVRYTIDGSERVSAGGRLDEALPPGLHRLEVREGELLLLDPELVSGGTRVRELVKHALPATWALPGAGTPGEIRVATRPGTPVRASFDDGRIVDGIADASGIARLPVGASASTLTLTGVAPAALEMRLLRAAPEQPAPAADVDLESLTRRVDAGDPAARLARAEALWSAGSRRLARNDLAMALAEPSTQEDARALSRRLDAAAPDAAAPGPVTVEAALAAEGLAGAPPGVPAQERARAAEHAARRAPTLWPAASDAWSEAGDPLAAAQAAERAGAEGLSRLASLAARARWTPVTRPDRSAGLVSVPTPTDLYAPDAPLRAALLASPWPLEEALVLRHPHPATTAGTGDVEVALFCRDEELLGRPCEARWRAGTVDHVSLVPDGGMVREHARLDAGARLVVEPPGPDHVLVVRLSRDGEPILPHATRTALRAVPGRPVEVTLAGGALVRVELVRGSGEILLDGRRVSLDPELPTLLVLPGPHTARVVVEGDTDVVFARGVFVADVTPTASLPAPVAAGNPADVLARWGPLPAVVVAPPSGRGTVTVGLAARRDVVGFALLDPWAGAELSAGFHRALGDHGWGVSAWAHAPWAVGTEAIVFRRWSGGYALGRAEAAGGGDARHAAIGAIVHQDLTVGASRLGFRFDLVSGTWNEEATGVPDPRVWTRWAAQHPRRASVSARWRASPWRDLEVGGDTGVTLNPDGTPDRVAAAALTRVLAGSRTVWAIEAGATWRLPDDLRSRGGVRPGGSLQVDHALWIGARRLTGWAEVATFAAPWALDAAAGVTWSWTGGRGLRDLPPDAEAFRRLRELP